MQTKTHFNFIHSCLPTRLVFLEGQKKAPLPAPENKEGNEIAQLKEMLKQAEAGEKTAIKEFKSKFENFQKKNRGKLKNEMGTFIMKMALKMENGTGGANFSNYKNHPQRKKLDETMNKIRDLLQSPDVKSADLKKEGIPTREETDQAADEVRAEFEKKKAKAEELVEKESDVKEPVEQPDVKPKPEPTPKVDPVVVKQPAEIKVFKEKIVDLKTTELKKTNDKSKEKPLVKFDEQPVVENPVALKENTVDPETAALKTTFKKALAGDSEAIEDIESELKYLKRTGMQENDALASLAGRISEVKDDKAIFVQLVNMIDQAAENRESLEKGRIEKLKSDIKGAKEMIEKFGLTAEPENGKIKVPKGYSFDERLITKDSEIPFLGATENVGVQFEMEGNDTLKIILSEKKDGQITKVTHKLKQPQQEAAKQNVDTNKSDEEIEVQDKSGAINYFLENSLKLGAGNIGSRIFGIKGTELPADFALSSEDQDLLTRVQSKIDSFHRLKDISGKSMYGQSLSVEEKGILDSYSNDFKKVRADLEAFTGADYKTRDKSDFVKAEKMLQPKVKEYIKTIFAPKVQPLLNLRNELALIDIPKGLSHPIMKPLNDKRNNLKKKLPEVSDISSLRRILSNEKPSSGSLTYCIKVADQLKEAMNNDALRKEVAEFNTKVKQVAKENNLETGADKREKFAGEIDNVLKEAETLPALLGVGRDYEIFNNQKKHLIEFSKELKNSTIPDRELLGAGGYVDSVIFNSFKSKVSEYETAIPQRNEKKKKSVVAGLSKDIKEIFPKAEDVPPALRNLFDRNAEASLKIKIDELNSTPVQNINPTKADRIRQEIKLLNKDVKDAWNKFREARLAVSNWKDMQRISKIPEVKIKQLAQAEIQEQGLTEEIDIVIAKHQKLKSLLKKDKLSSEQAERINDLAYYFVRFGSFENEDTE
jgi:hypothetical protein